MSASADHTFDIKSARLNLFSIRLRSTRLADITRDLDNRFSADSPFSRTPAMLDVSPNHLSACIKKSEGETFINILVRRRMETAQTLLLTTDLQIQEIARRCGYTDHSAFSRQFKAAIGTSHEPKAKGRTPPRTIAATAPSPAPALTPTMPGSAMIRPSIPDSPRVSR